MTHSRFYYARDHSGLYAQLIEVRHGPLRPEAVWASTYKNATYQAWMSTFPDMKFSIASWLLLAIFASLASASLAANLKKKKIKNLVTFGDSYTDVVITGDAGISWPTYAADYAQVSLYPFARAGATCSNNITFRPFPPLFESQLPLYFTEKNNGSLNLDAKKTLYTLWIGTNDLGVNSLISGNNNASLVDVANCMVDWVKVLYESGARNFLFQNVG
ncbi:hypothetical protein C0989_008646 [Termitomyces sp. Mn162]|nr:hypothetical protein C0989_008646 [Termitomyces sp. Mn162]